MRGIGVCGRSLDEKLGFFLPIVRPTKRRAALGLGYAPSDLGFTDTATSRDIFEIEKTGETNRMRLFSFFGKLLVSVFLLFRVPFQCVYFAFLRLRVILLIVIFFIVYGATVKIAVKVGWKTTIGI